MAMNRFPVEKFASIELNHVAFPKDGRVVSQTPLGEEFTVEAPCENGMWVCADISKGVVASIEEVTEPIGVVYTTEKEYDYMHYGLKHFGRKIAGDYPRVGILDKYDIITSNCFQYDDGEFADEDALFEALRGDLKAAPIFVVPVVGSPVAQLTATKPTEGTFGKVIKLYTMPNNEPGIKYEIINV